MKLTKSFLEEIFRLMFVKKEFTSICCKHLKYEHIPKEFPSHKLILKSIKSQWEITGKLPSIGVISQQYISRPEVQGVIADIKDTEVHDLDFMIDKLQEYIKLTEFQLLNRKLSDLFKQNKQIEAVELNATESAKIQGISLRNDAGRFVRVFGDFKKNNAAKQLKEQVDASKIPFFIDPLDNITYGGMDYGDLVLFILRSGVGKSTLLKWTGLNAAMMGYDVLHIQLEGSEDEARDKYSQVFTRESYNNIKSGNIPKETMDKIDRTIKQMEEKGRELYIYAFEKFGEPTMVDVREVVYEYEKMKGKFPDIIIIDSLDLLATGLYRKIDTDPAYTKQKMQKVAQLMKNLCTEIKTTRILTATQTCDIPPSIWNDPEKVIDRSMTEGDRTLVKPFTMVFTGNQTNDEYKKGQMRIFADKLRFYSAKKKIYPICTAFDKGAAYDHKRTMEQFYSMDNL